MSRPALLLASHFLGQCRSATADFDAAEANLNEAYEILSGVPGVRSHGHTATLTALVELYET